MPEGNSNAEEPDRGEVSRPWRHAAERGAGTLEYLGVAVVAAVIIAALLMVPMGPKMAEGVRSIVCGISAHSPWGAGGCSDDANTPQPCTIASSENSRESGLGVSVRIPKIPILKVSGEAGDGTAVMLEETSDGEYIVTVADSVYGGAGLEVGGDIEDVVALKAAVSARLNAGDGFQETFTSEEEAMEFYQAAYDHFDSGWNVIPGSTLARSFPTLDDQPPQREYQTLRLDLTGEIDAGVKRPSLTGGDDDTADGGSDGQPPSTDPEVSTEAVEIPSSWVPNIGADGGLSGEVQFMVDRGDDREDPSDNTYHYSMGYEIDGSFDVTAGRYAELVSGNDLSFDAERSRSGTYTIVTDDSGEVTGVEFETITYIGAQGEGVAEVSTIGMEISSEAEREAFRDWTMDPAAQWPDPTLEEFPRAGNPEAPRSEFVQMVYDQGAPHRNTYAVETGSDNGWWENVAGWLPWYDTSREYTEMELVDSQWAPLAQGTGPRTFEPNEGCLA